jgi:hypothetical protein
MTSNQISFFTAAIGLLFLTTSNDGAQAMVLNRPGTIVVEKMAIEVQWRHRHHQLRRQSRRQPDHDHRPKRRGDQADSGLWAQTRVDG